MSQGRVYLALTLLNLTVFIYFMLLWPFGMPHIDQIKVERLRGDIVVWIISFAATLVAVGRYLTSRYRGDPQVLHFVSLGENISIGIVVYAIVAPLLSSQLP
jgi:hypothetical protein